MIYLKQSIQFCFITIYYLFCLLIWLQLNQTFPKKTYLTYEKPTFFFKCNPKRLSYIWQTGDSDFAKFAFQFLAETWAKFVL